MSIKRILSESLPKKGSPVLLNEHEAHHAVKVLRLGDGTIVQVMDGKGGVALCSLMVRGKKIFLERVEESELPADLPAPPSISFDVVPAILEQVILKGEAMEWVIEKAVELGFISVQPLWSDHCVVQMKHRGAEEFQERWQKIADQALKQCGRAYRMEVLLPQKLEEAIHSPSAGQFRYWADESSAHHAGQKANSLLSALLKRDENSRKGENRLLIGPEGGFSAAESDFLSRGLSTHFLRVSLGSRVLRAETAAIYGMSLIQGFSELTKG